jgi:serine/threonine-protein kinase
MAKRAMDRYASFTQLRAALDAIGAASTPSTSRLPSIAVLPFANPSADKENEYFGDGLAEEILNALTRLPGLRVVARASAFAFRGREHEVGSIVEKLGVTSVLHGSVRRSGNRIRVSAQLIDVRDESQLWSERYDREMRDVFDIQDEIAQAIVESLKVQLGARTGQPLVKRYTENPVAHSLYLKGNFHLYQLTTEAVEKGRAYLEQALALEPRHAPAWVQLADYYIAGCFAGRAPATELWPRAKDAAQRAVESDPEYADAHAAVGFVAGVSEYRWADAMRHLDTALRLNAGSGRTHLWRSQVLMPMGRSEQSLESAAQAVALDPLFLLYRAVHGNRLLNRGAYEAAADGALQDLDIDPHFPLATMNLAHAYVGMGRHHEAIALMEKNLDSPRSHRTLDMGLLSWSYVAVERRADAERFVGRLEGERQQAHVPGSTLALATLGLGDHAGALRWLEASVAERDANLINVVADPYFEPLHAEPRYRSLLRRMNLA